MNVEKITPNARDTAMGIRNRACMLRSSIKGDSPAKVVSEVNRIGRKAHGAGLTDGLQQFARATTVPVDEVDHHQAVVDHDAGQRDQAEHRQDRQIQRRIMT